MSQPLPGHHFERRSAVRLVVDCPAQLRLIGSILPGRISDLSEHGARFECAHPPFQGLSGMLAWNGQEQFATVVWVQGKSCGMQFERPISLALVEAAQQEVEIERGPVANFGNIPIAEKRSRRFALVASGGSSPAHTGEPTWEP